MMKLSRATKLNRTTFIAFSLAAFLTGIGLAKTGFEVNTPLLIISFLFVLVSVRRPRTTTLICLIIFGLLLGWWRGSNYMSKLNGYSNLYDRQVSLEGTADIDAIYGKNSQLSFDLTNIHLQNPREENLIGKISVSGFGVNAIYKGDSLNISGKLRETLGSKQARMSYANITLVSRSDSVVQSVRRKFQAGVYSVLPEPLASFSLGLLIGQHNTLPEDVTNQLSATGLMHIVAVSGYNLTIIMSAIYIVLKKRSKYQSMVISFTLIALFVLMTGFSPSIVRAAIVSVLGLTAAFYGRKFRPILLILLTAALTAGFYPIYIWSDIGWYLSFLAFYGVLIIAPIVTKRIYKERKTGLVAGVAIESLSAQVMALPLIAFVFGEISLIALPANLLIVPLVPLAMLLAFIAGLVGMLLPALAGWFAWPAKILLTYMLDVVNLMSRIPNALVSRSLSVTELIVFYAIVVGITFVTWTKIRPKTGIITDRNQDILHERTF